MPSQTAALLAARPWFRAAFPNGLQLEGASLATIAEEHGTPCWVHGAATLRQRYRRLAAALPGIAIHYAVKANDDPGVLRCLATEGAGADVVSGCEVSCALRNGVPASQIVFSGVGKTSAELRQGLDAGIGQFNVESAEELRELAALARATGQPAPVALRVNPDVDAGTHEKIATGRAGDKFGIPFAAVPALYAEASRLEGIGLAGLALHIGSQVLQLRAFTAAYRRVSDLVRTLRADGLAVRSIDCGGGLGIPYCDEAEILPQAWGGCLRNAFQGLDVALAVEPGRWLSGPAGVLLSRVIRVKRHGMKRPVVILDAGMNDLARPAVYGAWHGIVPVAAARLAGPEEFADIVGPVCESADVFAQAREIARLEPGDLVAFLDAGAYGAVMSSTYNARPLAPRVMIDAGAKPDVASGVAVVEGSYGLNDGWPGSAASARNRVVSPSRVREAR